MQQLEGQNILIVENHEDTRLLFEEVFRIEGARVKAVATVLEALQFLTLYQPDLVICDIMLPQWDGYTLLNYIRCQQCDAAHYLPVIAVTSHVEDHHGDRELAAGFDASLRKPVDVNLLVEKAAELIHYHCLQSWENLFCSV